MKLSEELIYRGFRAETTIKDPSELDRRPVKKFYFGADPSADSLTIGNLAAMMMCACFVRHGYQPYLLVGGATGQIGDPKDTAERELKPLSEVEHNKQCIAAQLQRIIQADNLKLVDNYDWFKDINYLSFLREVGKAFSMTQLLDRQFIQSRIGEGGSGISYAEFSYTLIQGYDFLHLYRTYGIDLQLCGADQYGNCASGIHLIKRLENASADVWSTPLVIDPASGRKFGKSEGNAIWLDAKYTPVFDFYQFWLNQPDQAVEYLLKIYTLLSRSEIEQLLAEHQQNPAARLVQKALAESVTTIVHGAANAAAARTLTELLFGKKPLTALSESEISQIAILLPVVPLATTVVDALVDSGLASSKANARQLISAGAISVNSVKITADQPLTSLSLIKKGKNKFALVK
ncbi:MAG: tyrosine--tRNA ligase [Candidatus Saccharibacteria bacterium]|nr:tyrosine--tRNA ligase [Candidatus Saccharibacteria bacterium]